jgi:hypothetical protein
MPTTTSADGANHDLADTLGMSLGRISKSEKTGATLSLVLAFDGIRRAVCVMLLLAGSRASGAAYGSRASPSSATLSNLRSRSRSKHFCTMRSSAGLTSGRSLPMGAGSLLRTAEQIIGTVSPSKARTPASSS